MILRPATRDRVLGVLWIFLVLLVVLGSCSSVPAVRTSGPGEIVYIGIDGNIHLLDPSSGTDTAVTDDAGPTSMGSRSYRFPAWSPNGELAFLRYDAEDERTVGVTLLTRSTRGRIRTETRLGDIAPFFLAYSPGGSFLTALGNDSTGATLGAVAIPVSSRRPALQLGSGQPLYWDWEPDEDAIVLHTGGASSNDRISRVQIQEGSVGRYRLQPGPFQAPAVSSDGGFLAVVARDAAGSSLTIMRPDGGVVAQFAPHDGVMAFDWSPVEPMLAVVTGEYAPARGLIGELELIDMGDVSEPVQTGTGLTDVGPFFWSPDGTRIAALQPEILRESRGRLFTMNVMIHSLEDASSRQLTSYIPDGLFLTQVLPFFDQYQRSATIWSPESDRIVVSAIGQDRNPGIYVLSVFDTSNLIPENADERLPVSFVEHETPLATGTYPFWSP